VGSVAKPAEGYPSEEEIKQFYEANKAQLLAPAQYQVAQIFLPAAEGTDKSKAEEAKKKIGELSAKLGKSGADFAKLAKENSAHKESAEKGGELGWVSEEQMVPEIRRAITGMNKGEVSAPIKSTAGWHLIKLLDKKPAGTRSLAEVRPNLIVAMRNRKSQDLERAYLEALSIKLPPTINQIELGNCRADCAEGSTCDKGSQRPGRSAFHRERRGERGWKSEGSRLGYDKAPRERLRT
jgi:peptidylprolyl isomerase